MRIRARGRFRTVGGYGRGAGRGTEWAMRERCDGTVFQVFEGTVLVHDYRRQGSPSTCAPGSATSPPCGAAPTR